MFRPLLQLLSSRPRRKWEHTDLEMGGVAKPEGYLFFYELQNRYASIAIVRENRPAPGLLWASTPRIGRSKAGLVWEGQSTTPGFIRPADIPAFSRTKPSLPRKHTFALDQRNDSDRLNHWHTRLVKETGR